MAAMTRDEWLHVAKSTQQAQRHDAMVKFMDKILARCTSVDGSKQRKLLRGINKHVISPLRHAYKVQDAVSSEYNKFSIEFEFNYISGRIMSLLDSQLIPLASTSEAKAFYLKMKGDYSRYLAEFKAGHERERVAEEAVIAYKAAEEEVARADLAPTHPTRLGLALNIGALYADIMQDYETACCVAFGALEEATSERDGQKFSEESEPILELLRENFNLWTTNMETSSYIDHVGYIQSKKKVLV